MKKQSSNYQSVVRVLNTSSETFMLVALIALFALPFVIASNLEPAVRDAERTARVVQPVQVAQNSLSQGNTTPLQNEDTANSLIDWDEEAVLGVETVEKPFEIEEEKVSFGKFDTAKATVGENKYSLALVKKAGGMGKISLFKLTNDSSEQKQYTFEVVKGKTDSKSNKYVSLNFQDYLIGSTTIPKTFTLAPQEEMWFGVRSNDSKLAVDLTINVGLAE